MGEGLVEEPEAFVEDTEEVLDAHGWDLGILGAAKADFGHVFLEHFAVPAQGDEAAAGAGPGEGFEAFPFGLEATDFGGVDLFLEGCEPDFLFEFDDFVLEDVDAEFDSAGVGFIEPSGAADQPFGLAVEPPGGPTPMASPRPLVMRPVVL